VQENSAEGAQLCCSLNATPLTQCQPWRILFQNTATLLLAWHDPVLLTDAASPSGHILTPLCPLPLQGHCQNWPWMPSIRCCQQGCSIRLRPNTCCHQVMQQDNLSAVFGTSLVLFGDHIYMVLQGLFNISLIICRWISCLFQIFTGRL
jgi:hypothetical protein